MEGFFITICTRLREDLVPIRGRGWAKAGPRGISHFGQTLLTATALGILSVPAPSPWQCQDAPPISQSGRKYSADGGGAVPSPSLFLVVGGSLAPLAAHFQAGRESLSDCLLMCLPHFFQEAPQEGFCRGLASKPRPLKDIGLGLRAPSLPQLYWPGLAWGVIRDLII